jgi:hypothetical protein
MKYLNKMDEAWTHEQLEAGGYKVPKKRIELFVSTPYSKVARIQTERGLVYFKSTPALLGSEPKVFDFLKLQCDARVPIVLAHDDAHHRFLALDAGATLRSRLEIFWDIDLVCRAIRQFVDLQEASIAYTKDLLGIGVLDWRVQAMPDLFMELIARHDWLLADGCSVQDIELLSKSRAKVERLVKNVKKYEHRPTLVQPDFNDNNTLVDEQRNLTHIDLGELSVSHPLFSILNAYYLFKNRYKLSEESLDLARIDQACFEKHVSEAHAGRPRFQSAKIKTILPLFAVYQILSQGFLMQACGYESVIVRQPGRLRKSLSDFLSSEAREVS